MPRLSIYNGRRNDHWEHISIDVPKEMKNAIERYGNLIGKNKSQIVREAITQYLEKTYFRMAMSNEFNLKRSN